MPKAAEQLASAARDNDWTVEIMQRRGPALNNEGQEVLESTLVRHEDSETGGGSTRVYGDVKVVELVVVKAERGADVLYAAWVDGKFDGAYRPGAGHVGRMGSAAAKAHLQRSIDDHRWLPTKGGQEYCLHHNETRAREYA